MHDKPAAKIPHCSRVQSSLELVPFMFEPCSASLLTVLGHLTMIGALPMNVEICGFLNLVF